MHAGGPPDWCGRVLKFREYGKEWRILLILVRWMRSLHPHTGPSRPTWGHGYVENNTWRDWVDENNKKDNEIGVVAVSMVDGVFQAKQSRDRWYVTGFEHWFGR